MSIMGKCPYDDCDHEEWRLLPEHYKTPVDKPLPLFSKEICSKCTRTIWVYYSRIDPAVYTEEEFNRNFEISEDTKSIRRKAQ